MSSQNLSYKDERPSHTGATEKLKLLRSIAKLKDREQQFQQTANTLRQVIEQLSRAAMGRSAPLDLRVSAVLKAVRENDGQKHLSAELSSLSNLLQNGSIAEEQTNPEPIDLQAYGAETESAGTTALAVSRAFELFLSRIQALSEYHDISSEISQQYSEGASLREPLENSVSFVRNLLNRISALKKEKSALENLVNHADEQLEQILSHLEGQKNHSRQSEDSTLELNRLVLGEMEDLVNAVEGPSDIGALQARVHTRIVAIESHLGSFKEQERSRHREQRAQSEKLYQQVRELENRSKELTEQIKENERLILLDSLTGIANRTAYKKRFIAEQEKLALDGLPRWLVVWDIDRFKQINDCYGHKAGDRVLRAIAQYFSKSIRKNDFIARYGGEEFVMLIDNVSDEDTLKAINALREGISRLGFHFKSKPVQITASCGVTRLSPREEEDVVFERADSALYRAKASGRNCCIKA